MLDARSAAIQIHQSFHTPGGGCLCELTCNWITGEVKLEKGWTDGVADESILWDEQKATEFWNGVLNLCLQSFRESGVLEAVGKEIARLAGTVREGL